MTTELKKHYKKIKFGNKQFAYAIRVLNKEEVKQYMLKCLEEFDNFCKNNNLKYSICYGTLIGAVRHNGFIPWDDDIDVVMPRDDYEKFVNLYQDNDTFTLLEYRKHKSYLYPFAKLVSNKTLLRESYRNKNETIGAFIDIFPLDKTKLEISKELEKMIFDYYNHLLYVGINRKLIWKSNFKDLNKVKEELNKTVNLMIDLVKPNEMEDFAYRNVLWGAKNFIKKFPKDFFDKVSYVPFENTKFCAFNEYDYILRQLYGDYMQIPNMITRRRHYFKCYELVESLENVYSKDKIK